MNKKRILLFFATIFFAVFAASADAITGSAGSQRWLLNIASIFSQNWVKGLFCLLLIGQALGIMVSAGQNQQIAKTLIASLIATGVFFIAGLIVSKHYVPSLGFGKRNFAQFSVSKMFDVPIVMGMEDFFAMLYGLQSFVITLVTLACFLNIAFNCIKVWAGTQELKKMYVDIIYKSVLCLLLMNFYPSLQIGAFQLATDIGAHASGGITRLNKVFAQAVLFLREDAMDKIQKSIPLVAEKGSFFNKKGEPLFDARLASQIALTYSISRERVEQFLKEKNITEVYATQKLEDETYLKSAGRANSGGLGTRVSTSDVQRYTDMNGNVQLDSNEVHVTMMDIAKRKREEGKKQLKNDARAVEKQFNKLLALSEIMTGYSVKDMAEWDENERKQRLKEMMDDTKQLEYSPYLADKNGNQTQILSPSSLMKTQLLLSDALAMSCAYEDGTSTGEHNADGLDENFNATKDIMDEDDFTDKKKKFISGGNLLWDGLKAAFISILYWCAGMLCTILAMVEYTMVVWEYALITSLATLLIPFLFLDATKSFATNIIRIFLQYFAKIMVVTIATFYVMNMFISTTLYCFQAETSPNAAVCLAIYIFALILGVAFISGSEKIANILFTGSPVMSMGDVVKGARDVRLAAGGAATLAKTGLKGLGAGVGAAQGVVRGGQSAVAWGSGLKQAGQKARDDVTSSEGFVNDAKGMEMARQAATGARWSYVGASLGQGFKDAATKLFTGRDAQHFDKDGNNLSSTHSFQGVGGKYLDENGREQGTTTYGQAKKAAHSVANTIGQRAADELINSSRKGDQSMQLDSEKPTSANHDSKA